jgi:hypothetical protein
LLVDEYGHPIPPAVTATYGRYYVNGWSLADYGLDQNDEPISYDDGVYYCLNTSLNENQY